MSQQYPPEVENVTEFPELGETRKPYVPARQLNTDYPVRALPIPIPPIKSPHPLTLLYDVS